MRTINIILVFVIAFALQYLLYGSIGYQGKIKIGNYVPSLQVFCLDQLLTGEQPLGYWMVFDDQLNEVRRCQQLVEGDCDCTFDDSLELECGEVAFLAYEAVSTTCIDPFTLEYCKDTSNYFKVIGRDCGDSSLCEKVSCHIQPSPEVCGSYIITGNSPNSAVTFDITLPDGTNIIGNGPTFTFTSPSGLIIATVIDSEMCMPTCTFEAFDQDCLVSFPAVSNQYVCMDVFIEEPQTEEENILYSYSCINENGVLLYSGEVGEIIIENLSECVTCSLTAECENGCKLTQDYYQCPKIFQTSNQCGVLQL